MQLLKGKFENNKVASYEGDKFLWRKGGCVCGWVCGDIAH